MTVDDAASRLNVKSERVQAWESGAARPTVRQLRLLANVYKRPTAVFFLSEPPRDFQAMRDFRRFPDADTRRLSPELAIEQREAAYRRDLALELLESLSAEPPHFLVRVRTSDDPEAASKQIRKALDVDLYTQHAAQGAYGSLNLWKSAVEELGVLVFQTSKVPPSEMRGFSIAADEYPVIVLNAKDAPHGRVFTLLHELAHLALHAGGVCNLKTPGRARTTDQKIEVFCNHVAGAVLVPRSALQAEPSVTGKWHASSWPEEQLRTLANRFGVSQEVVLRRLLINGHASRDLYRAKREEYQLRKPRVKKESFPFPPSSRTIRDNGNVLINLILNAHYQNRITASRLSEHLGVRLKHLPKIQDQFEARLRPVG